MLVLLLALASGGIAGYAAWQLIGRQQTPLQAAQPRSSLEVVVAARVLPAGSLIGEEDVHAVDWPSDAVPAGYARSVTDVLGRGVTQLIRLNEPLLETKLADRGHGGLAIVIPEGMRAVAVRVDEVVGVAGFIDKGTRVDVLLTINPPNQNSNDYVSRIILQNVEVAARGQQIERDPEGRPQTVTVVTLLVSPEQAEQLTLATSQGKIQLALRNLIDVKEVRTTGARMSRLLDLLPGGLPAARPRGGALPSPRADDNATTVELFKGGKRALIRF
jgi:pilus assembly protein CpaB